MSDVLKEQEQMTLSIVESINNLFDKESDMHRYDWRKIDLTAFFTAYVKAGAYIYKKITNDNKNALEFTHLANQLVVQDMMEKKAQFVDEK